ncbi:hypothetical protein JKF63_02975 [Porcisia hertigi]|uniref:Uncharacterized protein n=1 Tax=Porcisia hertigi TaxID=2761500 RepID=A0A836INE5_9TRYP|nr:hypothetical protein JKF63_02975 [Porcisia hertigi]
MPHTSKKLLPIGGNMNDAAYPFRGDHRVVNCLNHGHSGVVKSNPTSIGMRISGSNLVIEQVRTPKGVELECELGVDGGIPRPVSLQQGSAFMVPGDGHDYNLIATVKANSTKMKHYCKLTFNGSEGTSVLRVRAPEGCSSDSVYIVADGRRLRPMAGWFRIPIHTKECALVANPAPDRAPLDTYSILGASALPPEGSKSAHSRSASPVYEVGNDQQQRGSLPESTHFTLETLRAPAGAPDQSPLLICASTGQVIPLTVFGTVAVPYNGAPYRLHLPPAASDGLPESTSRAPTGDALSLETRIEAPPAPIAGAASPVEPFAAAMPSFVATAPGFNLELTGESGSSALGVGVAELPLSHRQAQAVQIVVRDAQGRVVLRQRSHVPALEPAAAYLQLKDDEKAGLVVSTKAGSRLTVGGVLQTDPSAAAALPRIVPQQVVVEQPNADGTVSKVTLDVAARSGLAGAPTPMFGGPAPIRVAVDALSGPAPVPVPTALQMPTPTQSHPESWVVELSEALQKSDPEEQRRLVQNIRPSTIPGMTILNFVRDLLTYHPPAIAFTVSTNGLEAVECPGCSVTAAVGNDPARPIPYLGSVALTPGKSALLTASKALTKRAVSSCRVQMATSSAVGTAHATVSEDNRADTDLVNRLVDCLLRHNMRAPQVANELSGMSTTPFSTQGRRMLPLLASCLNSAVASGAAAATQAVSAQTAVAAQEGPEEIFFTCGPGYVDNIYSTHPQYHLFGAVDDQAPQMLQQRGRIPAHGALEEENKPFFIRLTAHDPATGSVKVERRITILGAQRAVYPAAGAAAPPPPAQKSDAAAPAVPKASPQESLQGQVPASATVLSSMLDRQQTPTSAAATMPYMDVSLQTVGQDVHARVLCHPHLRIVCDVDGIGGSTGRSDFVTKMLATRSHRVNLSLVDLYGKVVFQQKLDIPAVSSSLWGLALQHNGLAIDPEGGCVATASIDREAERTLQGNFVSFDASTPHFVYLRKYHNGINGGCSGALSLRLPGMTLPPELEEVTHIMRRLAKGQCSDSQAREELQHLRSRCTAPSIVDLINGILDGWPAHGGVVAGTSGRDSPSNRIFFRLTGTD